MIVRTLPTLAFALAGTACFSVDIDVKTSVAGTVTIGLGDLAGAPCSGSGTVPLDGGTATWTKTPAGDLCRLEASWTGPVVPAFRDQVEAKLADEGESLDSAPVTIDGVTLVVAGARLRDQAGADVTPPQIPHFESEVTAGGEPALALTLDQSNLATAAWPTATLAAPAVQALNQAFQANRPLEGSATVVLVYVPNSAAGTGVHLEIDFSAEIAAHAEKSLF